MPNSYKQNFSAVVLGTAQDFPGAACAFSSIRGDTRVVWAVAPTAGGTFSGDGNLIFTIQGRLSSDAPWATVLASQITTGSVGTTNSSVQYPEMRIIFTYDDGFSYAAVTFWITNGPA